MAQRHLDLGWLRTFDAVGRLGSLTRAAQELGLTQPAVTYQIRRVEEQLGLSLFHRSQGGSRLTEAGEVLFRAVRASVERIDDAAQETLRKARSGDPDFYRLWFCCLLADAARGGFPSPASQGRSPYRGVAKS
ncbi:LysR family transcriptional regulator [Thalassospira xiamenensis]|uniref:LysR family transcriptional regulator n=1 Tax=Thalassospira xiamenensis TaxID=220697 RepID=UPI003AA8C360